MLGPSEVVSSALEIRFECAESSPCAPHIGPRCVALPGRVGQSSIHLFELFEERTLVGLVSDHTLSAVVNLIAQPFEFLDTVLSEARIRGAQHQAEPNNGEVER
jgi:hypothetical protein